MPLAGSATAVIHPFVMMLWGETPRFGKLGRIRRWFESVFDTFQGQLTLEKHGGGTITVACPRLLALAAGSMAQLAHRGTRETLTQRLRPLESSGLTHLASCA